MTDQLPVPPMGSLTAYIAAVNAYPQLSPEQEYELAMNVIDNNCKKSAQLLISSHLRLVVSMARKYASPMVPIEDLIQEGNIGLMKSVKRFNPKEHSNRLVTFARFWIKAEMIEYMIKNRKLVKGITSKPHLKVFYNLPKLTKMSDNSLTDSEADEIARSLNVTKNDVLHVEKYMSSSSDVSISHSRVEDDDGDYELPAHSSYDPAVSVESEDYEEKRIRMVHEQIEALDERSKDIVKSRWFETSLPKPTLKELAVKYDISQERVRQIESTAFKTINMTVSEALH